MWNLKSDFNFSSESIKINLTENTNFSDSFFKKLKIFENSNELRRVYDNNFLGELQTPENIFISELTVIFKYMSDIGMQIVFIKGFPNNKIILNSDDLKSYKNIYHHEIRLDTKKETFNFNTEFFNQSNQFFEISLTNNWFNIKKLQAEELLLFFKKYFFQSLLTISHIKNNCYFFDMILIFDSKFDLNFLKELKFESIDIKKIEVIKPSQLTYSFFKELLDFKELLSYEFKLVDNLDWEKIKNNILSNSFLDNTKEFLDFENYKKKQFDLFQKTENDLQQSNDYLYWYYYNLKTHRTFYEKYKNYDIFLKNSFSQIGWNLYTLNFEWSDIYNINNCGKIFTYPVNDIFYLVYDPDFNYLNFEKINTNNLYFDHWCTLDLVDSLNFFETSYCCIQFHEISKNIIDYKTEIKTFLDLKKSV